MKAPFQNFIKKDDKVNLGNLYKKKKNNKEKKQM